MPFADVLGQDQPIGQLREALRRDRGSVSTLFVGPVGVGRRTLMQAFAEALLCPGGGDDACGACPSCRAFAHGNHPDLYELEREKERISVEEMREFCRQAGFRPMQSARRVCLVPDADRMTDQAANCFLKTLEEPPGATVLLLRSESTDRLLGTIVSRCRIVRLAPLPQAVVAATLRDRAAVDGDVAEALATVAEGSLGRALALAHTRPGDALPLADELLERAGREGGDTARLRAGAEALLDMLALALRRQLRDAALPRAGLRRLDAVWAAAERLQKNVSPDAVLRTLALDLVHAD
ncbi:MAG: DNA polymerase III subunit delta' [Planctomycetota bacterium]